MNQTKHRLIGAFLIFEALLIFVPLALLGATINFPGNLNDPASANLPLILAQETSVRIGYSLYLLFSILFMPAGVLLCRVLDRGAAPSAMLRVAEHFAVLSAMARVLGIIRWLGAMFALAGIYAEPGASATTKEITAIIYTALNAYAGMIGEVLGVGFFAAAWLALVSYKILQTRLLPRWTGILGFITAASLFGLTLEVFGVETGAVIAVPSLLLQIWLLAVGISLLRLKDQNYKT